MSSERDRNRQAKWRIANPERVVMHGRRRNLAKFGLTLDDYASMEAGQLGLCAACGCPERAQRAGRIKKLAVDHDHESGDVRGLLCQRCNYIAGHIEADPSRVPGVVDYLSSHIASDISAPLGRALQRALKSEGMKTLSEMVILSRNGRGQ